MRNVQYTTQLNGVDIALQAFGDLKSITRDSPFVRWEETSSLRALQLIN